MKISQKARVNYTMWEKSIRCSSINVIISDNVILASLPRTITSWFDAVDSLCGFTTWTVTPVKIKIAVWTHFAESITL